MHYGWGWHMGWMAFSWLAFAALLGAFLWFAAAARRRGHKTGRSPEQVLKQRYAKGEIDEPTYEHMLEQLRK